MRAIALAAEDDFEGWRIAARGLALAGVPADARVREGGGLVCISLTMLAGGVWALRLPHA